MVPLVKIKERLPFPFCWFELPQWFALIWIILAFAALVGGIAQL